MKKEELRIIYMGTPDFAVETLRLLVEQNYNVVAVVTMPDKPAGRGQAVCSVGRFTRSPTRTSERRNFP